MLPETGLPCSLILVPVLLFSCHQHNHPYKCDNRAIQEYPDWIQEYPGAIEKYPGAIKKYPGGIKKYPAGIQESAGNPCQQRRLSWKFGKTGQQNPKIPNVTPDILARNPGRRGQFWHFECDEGFGVGDQGDVAAPRPFENNFLLPRFLSLSNHFLNAWKITMTFFDFLK